MEGCFNKVAALIKSSREEIRCIKHSSVKVDILIENIVGYFENIQIVYNHLSNSCSSNNQVSSTESFDNFYKSIETLKEEVVCIKKSNCELENKHEDISNALMLSDFAGLHDTIASSADVKKEVQDNSAHFSLLNDIISEEEDNFSDGRDEDDEIKDETYKPPLEKETCGIDDGEGDVAVGSQSSDGNEEEYKCSECGQTFMRLYNYKQHQLLFKSTGICKGFHWDASISKFICDLCNKHFFRKATLKHHLMSHKQFKPINCYICSKTFSANNHLLRHFKRFHRNAALFKCEKCKHICTQSEELEEHMEYHRTKETGIKSYTCVECEKVCNGLSNFNRHMKIHSKKEYECPTCNKIFSREEGLQRHVQRHKEQPSFICLDCGKCFVSSSGLSNHVRIHKIEESEQMDADKDTNNETKTNVKSKPKLSCKKCSKVVSTSVYRLNYHQKYCTGEKTHICDKCGEGFFDPGKLKKHVRNHLKSEFSCPDCEKCFLSNDSLLHHQSKCHSAHKCEKCNKIYAKQKSLEVHMTVHGDEWPFKCETCNKSFSHIALYKGHVRIHAMRFTCEECGKAFSKKNNLDRHMMMHTGLRPHKCDVCGKAFTVKDKLQVHMRIHMGIKDYQCEICLNKFSERQSLNRHKLIHTGEKPFQCEFCAKCFNQRSALTSHRRIHTGEKPYTCDFCDMSFSQRSSMVSHMRQHGGDVPQLKTVNDMNFPQDMGLVSDTQLEKVNV